MIVGSPGAPGHGSKYSVAGTTSRHSSGGPIRALRPVDGLVRKVKPGLTNNDRWFLIQLYRWFPSILRVVTIVQPETLVRWHRAGFRCYWRWKSRLQAGRPQIQTDIRALIRLSVPKTLSAFGLPEMPVASGTSRVSCGKPREARVFTPIRGLRIPVT